MERNKKINMENKKSGTEAGSHQHPAVPRWPGRIGITSFVELCL
jgi:hypothetical protein